MTKQSNRIPAVYIATNKPNGTLYTGVTSNPYFATLTLFDFLWSDETKKILKIFSGYTLRITVRFKEIDRRSESNEEIATR